MCSPIWGGGVQDQNRQGAPARELPDHLPEDVKQDRWDRFMARAGAISREKLRAKVGRTVRVLVDAVRPDGVAVARSAADAPEIDGHVYVRNARSLRVGEFAEVRVERTDAYDLHAALPAPAALGGVPRRVHRVIARA